MTSFRLPPLLCSVALHGGLIGAFCALGFGAAAKHKLELRIAVLPAEAAVPIAASAPPVEVVEVERELAEVEPLLAEVADDPVATEVVEPAPESMVEAVAEGFRTKVVEAAAPDWLVRVRPLPPAPTEMPAPEPTPAQVVEQAHVVEVIPGHDPKPDYPVLARRRGWQGVTEIAVAVDESGGVLEAYVATTSGHAVLDRAALRAVKAWRFRGGAGHTKVIVEFRLTS